MAERNRAYTPATRDEGELASSAGSSQGANVHRLVGERAGLARGAEEGTFVVIADSGGGEIFIDEGFELVMRRHFVALASFLVQPHPPAFAVLIIVLNAHRNDRTNAGKGRCHSTLATTRRGLFHEPAW